MRGMGKLTAIRFLIVLWVIGVASLLVIVIERQFNRPDWPYYAAKSQITQSDWLRALVVVAVIGGAAVIWEWRRVRAAKKTGTS